LISLITPFRGARLRPGPFELSNAVYAFKPVA
jgi:hypothetical protein